MNDPAELERRRLEKFLMGKAGGQAVGPKKTTPVIAPAAAASPANAKTSSSSFSGLSSSPSYKHEERRKWEVKQERGRAELGTPKKPLEMEDSAAESAAKLKAVTPDAGKASVETYEERERRRRAEWKRQQSPSLALLDILDSVDEKAGDDGKIAKSVSTTPTKSAAPAPAAVNGKQSRRAQSEVKALEELLNLESTSGGGKAPMKGGEPAATTSPRLQSKEETANTFQQIGNVLAGLNDLLDSGSSSSSRATSASSSAGPDSGVFDAIHDSSFAAESIKAASGVREKKQKQKKKPQTKEERKLAKELKREARRPQWAQTLYEDFTDGEDLTQAQEEAPRTYLWNVDLQAEEKESKEFVKDAQEGIEKLENLSSMIDPEMDVDDFDEERFKLKMKEFFYSGKKTIRYIKRKSRQGSVRMASEAKKFMDDSVALIDTARDLKATRTEKAKAKFSRSVKKVKEGAQKLTKTVTTSIENEVERMRELREKVRIAERERKEREEEEKREREQRLQAAERETKVTKLSFSVDQLIYSIKKVEDDGFLFDYNLAVEFLKRARDLKEAVPKLLHEVAPGSESKFSHLSSTMDEVSLVAARFVKDWQTGSRSKAESMQMTGQIVKLARKFQQDLMDLILFI